MAMATVDLFARNKYMASGVLGCMATLIVEAALVAQFVPSENQSALLAAVAMFFIFQIFYGFCLDGWFPILTPLLKKHPWVCLFILQVPSSAT